MRLRGESHFLKEVEQRGTILELLSAEHPKAVNSFTGASEALLEAGAFEVDSEVSEGA